MAASRVQTIRVQRRVSIRGLARETGLSRQTIYDAESGARQPGLATLRRIAAALGVPVADLLDDEDLREEVPA